MLLSTQSSSSQRYNGLTSTIMQMIIMIIHLNYISYSPPTPIGPGAVFLLCVIKSTLVHKEAGSLGAARFEMEGVNKAPRSEDS